MNGPPLPAAQKYYAPEMSYLTNDQTTMTPPPSTVQFPPQQQPQFAAQQQKWPGQHNPQKRAGNAATAETIIHSSHISRENNSSTEDTTNSKEAARAATKEDTKATGKTIPHAEKKNSRTR